jgi:hypothetical protein
MGERRIVDKTIKPLQATSLSPDQVTARPANQLGVLPIGVYKGSAAFIDLDKLVNQPLVLAEKAYALDRIDDRDGKQVTLGAGAAVDSSGRERITVPSGEVWFINRIVVSAPAADGGGAYLSVNIRVSLWPDVATTPDEDGKAYWSADKEPLGTPVTLDLPAQGELGEELRLPAGSSITLVATVKGAALAADTTASITLYGRKGKALVE